MNAIPTDLTDERFEARRQVEAHCQSLVDAGSAQWHVNEDGDTELHLDSGEVYRFADLGVMRLR